MRDLAGISITAAAAALLLAACGDTTIESGGSSSAASYPEAMAEICIRTEAELAELPDPPDAISVSDFAAEAARILGDEAEAARRLDPPDELDDDHRAFVANTDEQAAGWVVVARSADEALAAEMTRLAELTLGRDDLAAEMGIPECRRRN